MIKKLSWLSLLCLPFALLAEPGEGDMSDECLRSTRDLYKFYYYEIQPNPKTENCKGNQTLSSAETLQMQAVVGELKKNCSPQVIARINESLKTDLPASNIATG